jgi:uncharacterized protein DUF6602
MASKIVRDRIVSIVDVLRAAHAGSRDISSSSKGRERELFINMVLGNIISQPFRVGSGDIVDRNDNKSGQVDVVIEYSNTLSFPSIYPHSERLYLAESICAVVEVKSNLATQWIEAVKKAQSIFCLDRKPGVIGYVGGRPPNKIPVFIVGYEGWANAETARANLETCNQQGVVVSGVLQLQPSYYIGAQPDYAGLSFTDERGLFGFLLSIEHLTSSMLGSKPPFMAYMRES